MVRDGGDFIEQSSQNCFSWRGGILKVAQIGSLASYT
jgi:hypothetical protein